MIDPVERPGYGSLSAPHPDMPEPRRRPIVPWLIAAAALAFAVGLIANPWFERNVRAYLPGAPVSAADNRATIVALQARLAALEAARRQPPAAPAPGTSAQVASQIDDVEQAQGAAEQQLSQLQAQLAELRARTESSLASVAQDAERAQTVLLVTALRRAIENGQRIDAYEPALRARFGATHAPETAALLALGRAPATPDALARQLAALAPQVERLSAGDGNWWEQLKQGLADVVAVRRAGDTGADPADRLRLAAAQAQAGNVAAALRTVATLPPEAQRAAGSWTAAARRYLAGMQALTALEVAALTPAPPPAPQLSGPTTRL